MAERRLRRPAVRAGRPATLGPPGARALWAPALAGLLVLTGVVAGGWAMGRALAPAPAGALAGCHTQATIGPRHFAGPPAMCIDVHHKYLASVDTTRGRIGILLDPSLAPRTVNNFIVLAVNGYYNGLEFFDTRSWVLQTGDPLESGHGGPGYALPPEGRPGLLTTGSVGMAKIPGGPINGSQVFIMRGSWPGGGPGKTIYNRFGSVLKGYGLLSEFRNGDRILDVHVKRE